MLYILKWLSRRQLIVAEDGKRFVSTKNRGVTRIFQGGQTVPYESESTHQIDMAFSPPVVGCLLKKGLTKGGGGITGTPGTLRNATLPQSD